MDHPEELTDSYVEEIKNVIHSSEDSDDDEHNRVSEKFQRMKVLFKFLVHKYGYVTSSLFIVLLHIKCDLPIPCHIFANDIAIRALKHLSDRYLTLSASAAFTVLYLNRFIQEIRLYDVVRNIKPVNMTAVHSLIVSSPTYLSIPWIYTGIKSIYPKIQQYKSEFNVSMLLTCLISTFLVYHRYKDPRQFFLAITRGKILLGSSQSG